MTDAKRHAESEYERSKDSRKALRHAEADRTIAELKEAEKSLPKVRRKN